MSGPTRRLAAILFSDLVGYTTQMGVDEQRAIDVVERSRRLQRQLVEKYRGQWIQEVGDGSVAIFPSAVEAVRCALEIQREALGQGDLPLRIGIHEGDVLVDGSDVFGDGVNLAARLQTLARTGGICASERVFEDVRNQPDIRAVYLGEPRLKNVERPIRVYALSDSATREIETPRLDAPRGWRRLFARPVLLGLAVLVLLAGGVYATGAYVPWVAKLIVRAPGLVGSSAQDIGFATSRDGTRIAYATTGAGPAVVNVIGWFTHLEHGLNSPAFSLAPRLEGDRLYVRYDGRGTGLSDRQIQDYSLEARVADLEAVVDALGLDRFAIYAQSAGGPPAIAYDARHPGRVTRMVIYGSFARIADGPERLALMRSLPPVIRTGWGQDTPAFRQIFTSLFMPDRDEVTIGVFNEFQRLAAMPEDAARFMEAQLAIDVRDLASQVRVPVLVIHQRGDLMIPYRLGRELATLIPDARLLTLDGNDHALAPRSPEGRRMLAAAEEFLAADAP